MKFGICGDLEKAQPFASAGGDYLEAGVQSLLKLLEPDAAFEESLRRADACPLPILAANGFLPATLKSTGKDYNPQGILDYAAIAFARARKIGIRHIVFGSGGSRGLVDDFPVDEADDQFIAMLRQLGPIAADHDVIIVIEPLRAAECNYINTLAQGAAIVRRVGHAHIQLLADLYHMMHNGETAQCILDAGPMIKHAHLAEKTDRTCPGIEGTDFVPFFKALAQIGYSGAMSIEGKFPNGVPADSPRAVRVMREQMLAAGAG